MQWDLSLTCLTWKAGLLNTMRKGNWEPYDNRPPWCVVSSRELSKIYGVSLNTVNTWRMRELIQPVSHPKLPSGNRNYYRIYEVKHCLEGVLPFETCWQWARRWVVPHAEDIETLGQVEFYVKNLFDLIGVQSPLIPADFETLDRNIPVLSQI